MKLVTTIFLTGIALGWWLSICVPSSVLWWLGLLLLGVLGVGWCHAEMLCADLLAELVHREEIE